MSKSIKPEELSKVIQDYLENYREDIQEDVEEVTDKVTKEARDELKQTSPKGARKRYHKGWSVKLQKKHKLRYEKVIWNKTDYQLTHLLEFGHGTRSGGRTKAIPHIRPVEEKYNLKFVDLLEKKIKEDSK